MSKAKSKKIKKAAPLSGMIMNKATTGIQAKASSHLPNSSKFNSTKKGGFNTTPRKAS